jgi:hypothetical protein
VQEVTLTIISWPEQGGPVWDWKERWRPILFPVGWLITRGVIPHETTNR